MASVRLILAVCLAFAAPGLCAARDVSTGRQVTPEIWFNPLSWEISKATGHIDYSYHDFPNLLRQDAAWAQAASRVGVVSLPHNVVWSYPDRHAVVQFFRDHHFKTALSFGMLFNGGGCANGIEGMSQDQDVNRESVRVAELWKEAGGDLDYTIMDAPLGYGHFLDRVCKFPIDEVARRTVATLNGIRTYFPDTRVVDAEGPGRLPDAEWLTMMNEWLNDFRQHAGRPIDMIALDLHWRDLRPGSSWQQTSIRSAAFFHTRGVNTGLIVNDDHAGAEVTDAAWMNANRAHIEDVARGRGLGLDFVLINGWMGHPRNNLPEDDPLAYTSLIDFAYDAFRSPH